MQREAPCGLLVPSQSGLSKAAGSLLEQALALSLAIEIVLAPHGLPMRSPLLPLQIAFSIKLARCREAVYIASWSLVWGLPVYSGAPRARHLSFARTCCPSSKFECGMHRFSAPALRCTTALDDFVVR